jgi:hypothetical protein
MERRRTASVPSITDEIARHEREAPMSEHSKDVLALVFGTALVMLLWLAIGGGTYRPSADTEMGSRSVGSQPVSAIGAVTVGLER